MGVLLTALHLALAAWLTLRSVSAPWVVAGNTMPLRTIRADLALGAMPAVEHLGGALLLLAPLGLLLPLAGGRVDVRPLASFSRTVFAGFMVAFGVEVVRTGFAGQVFDVDTLLLNTAGVALAHLLLVPGVRAALRRRGYGRGAVAAAPAPSLPRVGATP